MYLSDTDIQKKINNGLLKFGCEDEKPFVASEQIQPCSVDLRLASTYWKIQKNTIDLLDPFLSNKNASRLWKKCQVRDKVPIVIKPGQTILASTYEKITIPVDCAGKIEAKSSFNRLALSITNGDFCNPGYVGHFPLQIHNMGKHTIKIYPFMSICQIILIKLSTNSEIRYGDSERQNLNIYMNDDGGPSRWFADKTIRKLIREFKGTNIDGTLEKITNESNDEDIIEVLRSLKNYYQKHMKSIHDDELYEKYIRYQSKRKHIFEYLEKIVIYFGGAGVLTLIVNSISKINWFTSNSKQITFLDILVIILPLILSGVLLFAYTKIKEQVFFTPKKNM